MKQICDSSALDSKLRNLPRARKYRVFLYDNQRDIENEHYEYGALHQTDPSIQWELKNPELSYLFHQPIQDIFLALYKIKGFEWGVEEAKWIGELVTHALMQYAIGLAKVGPKTYHAKQQDVDHIQALCQKLYSPEKLLQIKHNISKLEATKNKIERKTLEFNPPVPEPFRSPIKMPPFPVYEPSTPEETSEEEEEIRVIPIPTPLKIRIEKHQRLLQQKQQQQTSKGVKRKIF